MCIVLRGIKPNAIKFYADLTRPEGVRWFAAFFDIEEAGNRGVMDDGKVSSDD
jgi:hypothetical protein